MFACFLFYELNASQAENLIEHMHVVMTTAHFEHSTDNRTNFGTFKNCPCWLQAAKNVEMLDVSVNTSHTQ